MPRKAKPTKHSSAVLEKRANASLQNKGGGQAGLKDRKGGSAGHSRFLCPICRTPGPSLKSLKVHHDAKHSQTPWDPSKCTDTQRDEEGGKVQTTVGVGVRGTTKSVKGKQRHDPCDGKKPDDGKQRHDPCNGKKPDEGKQRHDPCNGKKPDDGKQRHDPCNGKKPDEGKQRHGMPAGKQQSAGGC